MKEDGIMAGGIAGIGVIITFLTGIFTPLFYMLVFFEILDYISGMYSAWRQHGWSSKEALEGAVKKFFYFFVVAVAFGFDYMIIDVTNKMQLDFNYPAVFGSLAMWFLLSTELISIVENLSEVGISIPFLTDALKSFREKISGIGRKKDS